MAGTPILRTLAAAAAAVLLVSCSPSSNWHLMDSGYSIGMRDARDFDFEVHVNQLKVLGGDVRNAEFRRFVSERLKLYGMCPAGWALLPCVQDGSCIQRTHRSVTVTGRCAASG